MELFELIQKLTAAYGPSGDEGEVRELIASLAAPYADEITVDTMGRLIVHKRGNGPRVMLCAHMDSIGFIVTHIEKEGFLRVGRLGGISPKEAAYTPVRFKNGLRGTFVPEEKADFGKLKLDECYVDVGAPDEAAAKALVQIGDTAVYDGAALQSGETVISPYLDDRIACAILLQVLEQAGDSPNDLYFVFSVQEEVGLRGAKTAAWAVDPDYALAVDVTDTEDTPGTRRSGTCQLGRGAAVKVMDTSVICHPAMVEHLNRLAGEAGIPVQQDILWGGGTDAGPIHTTRLGVVTGGISVPCRYVHTPVETADLGDTQACVQLLTAFVRSELDNPGKL